MSYKSESYQHTAAYLIRQLENGDEWHLLRNLPGSRGGGGQNDSGGIHRHLGRFRNA